MSFCSNVGIHIHVHTRDNTLFQYLSMKNWCGCTARQGAYQDLQAQLTQHNMSLTPVATILPSQNEVYVRNSSTQTVLLHDTMTNLRQKWERTSYRMELMQCTKAQVQAEKSYLASFTSPQYTILPQHRVTSYMATLIVPSHGLQWESFEHKGATVTEN